MENRSLLETIALVMNESVDTSIEEATGKKKKAKDIKVGDKFIANVAPKKNAWSEPTVVTATDEPEETIFNTKNVSIYVEFKPKRGKMRTAKVSIPKSKVLELQ